jgi:hypothetical protein
LVIVSRSFLFYDMQKSNFFEHFHKSIRMQNSLVVHVCPMNFFYVFIVPGPILRHLGEFGKIRGKYTFFAGGHKLCFRALRLVKNHRKSSLLKYHIFGPKIFFFQKSKSYKFYRILRAIQCKKISRNNFKPF